MVPEETAVTEYAQSITESDIDLATLEEKLPNEESIFSILPPKPEFLAEPDTVELFLLREFHKKPEQLRAFKQFLSELKSILDETIHISDLDPIALGTNTVLRKCAETMDTVSERDSMLTPCRLVAETGAVYPNILSSIAAESNLIFNILREIIRNECALGDTMEATISMKVTDQIEQLQGWLDESRSD